MNAKLFLVLLSTVMLVMPISLSYFIPEPTITSEEENWAFISNVLRCFLEDPMTNYSNIEQIEDLFYWTNIYAEVYDVAYVRELFTRHFQVKKIDSKTLDVIFLLLIKYSWPPNNWDDVGIKPIVSRIVELIEDRPVWFFYELINRSDWKEILRLIALNKTIYLRDYFDYIPDRDPKADILGFLDELENNKKTEVQRLEKFLKDPVNNFDQIKDICFLCSIMALRDWRYINEDKILPPEYFSPGVISDYIETDTDEKKIEILIHLISHCTTGGLEPEVIMETGAKVFLEHPTLFASCLSKSRGWRSIVYLLSYFLNYRDPGFSRLTSILGNTNFEYELKGQLIFLSSIRK